MAISSIRRFTRRVARRTKSWTTIVSLTLRGNRVEKKAKLQGCKEPVLLLYGFGATRRTFSILEKRIYQDGYTVFSINLGGILGTFNSEAIEILATHIDHKIERLYEKYKIKGKLSIISHSKGGLIGHYYVKRLGGDRRVKTLITLGTPHNGNPWAMVFSYTPVTFVFKSIRQMAPMSPFIQRLKQGPFPKKTDLYSIFSKDDRVCPYPVAVLEETANVKNVEIQGISHSEFLIKKSVYHVIKHALDGNMPKSLEDRTRERVLKNKLEDNRSTTLRLIEGAKKLALRK